IFFDLNFKIADLLYLVNEPAVNSVSGFGNGVYTYTHHQRILYSENAIPFRCFNMFKNILSMHHAFSVITEANRIVLQALTSFLNCFGETSSDRHHFTYTF